MLTTYITSELITDGNSGVFWFYVQIRGDQQAKETPDEEASTQQNSITDPTSNIDLGHHTARYIIHCVNSHCTMTMFTPPRRLLVLLYCLWNGSLLYQSTSTVSGFQFVPATAIRTSSRSTASRHTVKSAQPKRFSSGFFGRSALRSSNDDNDKANGVSTTRSTSTSKVDSKENPHNESFDWNMVGKQFELFIEMAGPYYKESNQARLLLAGVLALTLTNSGVSVAFSYLGKDFWTALSEKNVAEFTQILIKYCGALLLGAPVITAYRYQKEQLSVHWREWMTVRTFQLYSQNRVYYNLALSETEAIDNPDQRIAEDVNSFTSYSLTLVITLLTSLIDLASFSVILWNIYPQLYYAIIGYALFGTLITAWLGKNLVGLQFGQLQREADLRYALVRLRDNSESIAFYAGEDIEGRAVERRVDSVMDNKRGINAAQRNLEFFTTAYSYLVQILPVAVVAPKYFAGDIALGVISQSAGAFNHILNDLSIIVNQFEALSRFSAGVDRLSTFYQAMREVDATRDGDFQLLQVAAKNETETVTAAANGETGTVEPSHTITLHEMESQSTATILSIDHLELSTPDQKRVLIRDLSMNLLEGQNLLIVGNSGAGKSSLLRAIAGLWTAGSGSISRPCNDEVYFLPQRPYCTVGSLRDQLLYPSLDYLDEDANGDDSKNDQVHMPRSHWLKQSMTDDDLLQVLEKVDLLDVAARAGDGDPAKGLQAVLDWSNMLSLGEQQRLAFGRLLVNRPKLVVLDEASSALDMVAEARMYSILQNMAGKTLSKDGKLSAPGLTYISVGHRPSLIAYHDKKLRLAGESEYELTDIEKSAMQIPTISNL
jgi:putative ATP-binding cassette transporter